MRRASKAFKGMIAQPDTRNSRELRALKAVNNYQCIWWTQDQRAGETHGAGANRRLPNALQQGNAEGCGFPSGRRGSPNWGWSSGLTACATIKCTHGHVSAIGSLRKLGRSLLMVAKAVSPWFHQKTRNRRAPAGRQGPLHLRRSIMTVPFGTGAYTGQSKSTCAIMGYHRTVPVRKRRGASGQTVAESRAVV